MSDEDERGAADEVAEGRTRVDLVGDVRVRRGAVVLGSRQLGGTKPRLVLVSLVLSAGLPVSKERLVEQLWGEHPPEGAVPALESHVSVLRSRLAALGGSPRLVATVPHGYMVDTTRLDVDVWQAEAVLALPPTPRGSVPTAAARATLRRALERVDGPLLADEADLPWLEAARARHGRLLGELRSRAARYELEAGNAEEGLRLAARSLEQDPLDERSWCTLLEGHIALGQPVEAVRAFTRCRDVLRQHLGCVPGPRVQVALRRALGATADDGSADLLVLLLRMQDATLAKTEDERRRVYSRARSALLEAASV
ncbi:AfsR/SARP family transcriptional regulator [Aquipuribacter sp. MA13-6]|uniref:AfsR/SARP family transcriptional regulator n=1 Tax=unclassified Aquipuribacter TaxID=2635084 RepID=UPI003EEA2E72